MISLLEDNTVLTESENVNSGHSEKALTPLTKLLAETFIYRGAMDANRPDSELVAVKLKFDGISITVQQAQYEKISTEIPAVDPDSEPTIQISFDITRLPERVFTPLDDLTEQDERTQRFASFFFTPEHRRLFIDSLPRRQVRRTELVQDMHRVPDVDNKGRQRTRPAQRIIPMTQKIQIVGNRAVEVDVPEYIESYDEPLLLEYPKFKDGKPVMIGVDTGEVDIFIKYKGKLYKESELI